MKIKLGKDCIISGIACKKGDELEITRELYKELAAKGVIYETAVKAVADYETRKSVKPKSKSK